MIRRRVHSCLSIFKVQHSHSLILFGIHNGLCSVCVSVCVCEREPVKCNEQTQHDAVYEYVWIITCSPGLSTKRICPIITFINAREWAMCTMYRVHYGTAVLLYCFNTCCALCTNNIDKNGRLLALCSRRTSSSPLPSHSPSQKSAL